MKKLNLIFTTILILILAACGDDEGNDPDDVDGVSCAAYANDPDVQAAIQSFSEAASAYGQNPTEETCNNYLNSLDNYFDVIDVYLEACYNNEEWENYKEAVDQWRAERDDLDCDID